MKKIISFASPLLIILTLLISLVSFSSQAQAQNIGSLRAVVAVDFSFRKDLQVGDTDPDVLELQKLLNADVDTVIAATGPGSAGKESTYFGPLTKASVIKFQTKYRDVILTPAGLMAGTGYVGRLTRTKLNLLIGVMNTYASVGLPQSRAGAGTAAYVQSTTTGTPNTGSSMTTCQFVNLLIDIGAIVPGKANQARSALGCATVSTGGSTGGTTGGGSTTGGNVPAITPRVPSVDIKINGLNGPISIVSATDVTLSWTSSNVTSCHSLTAVKPLSGSEAIRVTGSGIFAITCTGSYGTVTDSVAVNLTSTNSNLSVSCLADPNNLTVNNSVTWKTTVTGGNGTYTYDWSGDVTGSTKNVSKQYTTTGIKNGVVSVTSGSLTASASCLALVNAVSNIVATSSLQVSCSGAPAVGGLSAVWTATASGGTSGYTYSWSGDATGSSNPSSKTYTTAGTKTATVNVTSGSLTGTANCSTVVSAADVASTTLQVSCVANPNPATTGSTITWTVFPLGGTGTYSYVWNGDATNHNPSRMMQSDTAGTVSQSVVVTSGTQTATANCSVVVNAAAAQALQVSCAANPYAVTLGDAITWTATASGGTGTYTYSWSGTDSLSSTRSTFSKTYSTVGSKSAVVSVTSGSSNLSASCTASITETEEEAERQCNGRFSTTTATTTDDDTDSTDDDSDTDSFGWFGGLVTESGECEISPDVYVPFFAVTQCGDSDVSQLYGPMDGYVINFIGSVSEGDTVLGNAIPGLVCMDRTDLPIGVVTKLEPGDEACAEDNDDAILDQILDALGDLGSVDSLISW